jgi:uncharacterized protein involved in outer membrane biogenesis
MSSAIATRTISSKASSIPRWVGWLALTLVIVVAGIAGTALLEGPHVISRVTVVNPSPYTVELETAAAGRNGWTLLGATQPKSTSSIEDVVDQGSEWVFRVRAQGVSGGDFVVSRDRLEQARWRVTVPAEVIDRLESQRIAPSPRIAR